MYPIQNPNLCLHTYIFIYFVTKCWLQMVENLAEVIEHGTRDQQSDALVFFFFFNNLQNGFFFFFFLSVFN